MSRARLVLSALGAGLLAVALALSAGAEPSASAAVSAPEAAKATPAGYRLDGIERSRTDLRSRGAGTSCWCTSGQQETASCTRRGRPMLASWLDDMMPRRLRGVAAGRSTIRSARRRGSSRSLLLRQQRAPKALTPHMLLNLGPTPPEADPDPGRHPRLRVKAAGRTWRCSARAHRRQRPSAATGTTTWLVAARRRRAASAALALPVPGRRPSGAPRRARRWPVAAHL